MRLLIICLWLPFIGLSQEVVRYTPEGHSHNDYAGPRPFHAAYEQGFGSIEADIWLVNDTLWVGHTLFDLKDKRTLDSLYLVPLGGAVNKNKGNPYPESRRSLQMMIDVKTAALPTLQKLVSDLEKHPELTKNRKISWVISGNRPPDSLFSKYPPFIGFDGDLFRTYTADALERIPMMSADLARITTWKGQGSPEDSSILKLNSLINQAHRLHKTTRFWNAPDNEASWSILIGLGADLINTDHIEELAVFRARKK